MNLILSCLLGIFLFVNMVGPQTYSATAYCLKGRTASGTMVRRGIVATGKHVPLGSKVYIDAGAYTGTYLVADRGVRGNRVDIWVPSCKEALRFGRRTVKLTVLK